MKEDYTNHDSDEKMFNLSIFIVIAVFAFIIGFKLFSSYMEMKAFNRITKGEKATYLDALFSDLRIITQ